MQVLIQKILHSRIEIVTVLLVMETMAFIALHHIFNLDSTFAQTGDDLVGLCFIDTGIVCTLCDEQRRLDLVDMQSRRDGRQQVLVFFRVADHFMEFIEHRFPIWRDRLHERKHVGDTHIVDRCRIQVGRKGNAR